jgi:hypothetical protein
MVELVKDRLVEALTDAIQRFAVGPRHRLSDYVLANEQAVTVTAAQSPPAPHSRCVRCNPSLTILASNRHRFDSKKGSRHEIDLGDEVVDAKLCNAHPHQVFLRYWIALQSRLVPVAIQWPATVSTRRSALYRDCRLHIKNSQCRFTCVLRTYAHCSSISLHAFSMAMASICLP